MVSEFHWIWATEWLFFWVEVIAGYAFYRYGKRLDDRTRLAHLLDTIVDEYFERADQIEERIEDLEEAKPWVEKRYSVAFAEVQTPTGVCAAAAAGRRSTHITVTTVNRTTNAVVPFSTTR